MREIFSGDTIQFGSSVTQIPPVITRITIADQDGYIWGKRFISLSSNTHIQDSAGYIINYFSEVEVLSSSHLQKVRRISLSSHKKILMIMMTATTAVT